MMTLALAWQDELQRLRGEPTNGLPPHVGTRWFNAELERCFSPRCPGVLPELVCLPPASLAADLLHAPSRAWLPLFFQQWLRFLSELLSDPNTDVVWHLKAGERDRLLLEMVKLEQACIHWLRDEGFPKWDEPGVYGIFCGDGGNPAPSGCHVVTCIIVPTTAPNDPYAGIYAGNFQPTQLCQEALDAALAAVQYGLQWASTWHAVRHVMLDSFLPVGLIQVLLQRWRAWKLSRILGCSRIYVTIGGSATRGPVHGVDGGSLALGVALAILLELARRPPNGIRLRLTSELRDCLVNQQLPVSVSSGLDRQGECTQVDLKDKLEAFRSHPAVQTMYLPLANESDLRQKLGLELAPVYPLRPNRRRVDLPDGLPNKEYRCRSSLWAVLNDLKPKRGIAERIIAGATFVLNLLFLAVIGMLLALLVYYGLDFAAPPTLNGAWVGTVPVTQSGPNAMSAVVPRPGHPKSSGQAVGDADLRSQLFVFRISRSPLPWSHWGIELQTSVGSVRPLGGLSTYQFGKKALLRFTGDYAVFEYRYSSSLEGIYDPITIVRRFDNREEGRLTLYIRPESAEAAAQQRGPTK